MERVFGEMSSGFQPAGPLAILFFVLAVLFVILFFAGVQMYRRRGALMRRRRFSLKAFSDRIRELNLPKKELFLLESMSVFLTRPPENRHLLVTRQETFDECARKLIQIHPEYETELMTLRVRLGFRDHPLGGVIHTTAEIPIGTILEDETGKKMFEVLEIGSGGIVARDLQTGAGEGAALSLRFHREEGRYDFHSALLHKKDENVLLRHALRVSHVEGRGYHRVPISLPVKIDRIQGRSVDLSGGGGCIRVPAAYCGDFVSGLEYPLQIEVEEGNRIELKVRITGSEQPDLLHFTISSIREGMRDRLIHRLNSEARRIGEIHTAT